MRNLVLLALLIATPLARPQATLPVQPFSPDEIEIYRQFLLHFQDYDQALSYIIGMDPYPVPFKPDRDGYRKEHVRQALAGFNDTANTLRKLPPHVLELTTEQAVVRRINPHDLLSPAQSADRHVGRDGFVKVHFTLSDISFDATHQHAAFSYSATCGCLGGSGATLIYQRKGHRWAFETIVDGWEG